MYLGHGAWLNQLVDSEFQIVEISSVPTCGEELGFYLGTLTTCSEMEPLDVNTELHARSVLGSADTRYTLPTKIGFIQKGHYQSICKNPQIALPKQALGKSPFLRWTDCQDSGTQC